MKEKAFYKKSCKILMRMYAIKKKKLKFGLSARKVMDLVIAEFGVLATARNIHHYVKYGIVGQYPLKWGVQVTFIPLFLMRCV